MSTKNYLILTKKYRSLISFLHTVYRLINSSFNMRDLLVKLTKLFSQITKAESVSIALLNHDKRYIAYRTKIINQKVMILEKREKINNAKERKVIKHGLIIKNNTSILLPLLLEDIIGLISIKKKSGGLEEFDNDYLLTISGQIVTAIRNQQLYKEQQNLIQATIKSLVTLLDSKIPTAYTHSKLFLKLIEAMADLMNLKEDERISLCYAGMLHDTGKIDVPFEIITKTSQLTGDEFDLMKQHPVRSAYFIKHLEALKPAVPIILHHHEKYDGTGYPARLKGNQIPLGARIMSVADAFDAMISGRPYRIKMTKKDVIKEINKNTGTQFDPNIVEILKKTLECKKIKKLLQSD